MAHDNTPTVAFVLSGGASLGALGWGGCAGSASATSRRARLSEPPPAPSTATTQRPAPRASRPPMPSRRSGATCAAPRYTHSTRSPDCSVPRAPATTSSRVGIRRLIARHIQDDELEQMPIPLHVVAIDVIPGEELRLSRGPVLEGVLASAAIPARPAARGIGDRTLMDGRVANNTSIFHAVQLGAERIYVLPTGHACTLVEPPGGASRWRRTPSPCSPTID